MAKGRQDALRALCGRVHEDDGINPKEDRAEEPRRESRKTLQLCAQVRRAIDGALQGECRDPVLRRLRVVVVEPAPDASRLRVWVEVERGVAAASALGALGRAHGLLRTAAAQAVSRKRAPELVFGVTAHREDADG